MSILTFRADHPAREAEPKRIPEQRRPELRTNAQPVAGASRLQQELTHLLFDQEDRNRVHGAWRQLLAAKEFRHRAELSPGARTALAYERLRMVNTRVESPLDLAGDVRSLAALHEWVGVADGGVCTLASIHYNLFLGSLLDHRNGTGGRDLSEFTAMRSTGTFLCTELDHGNDAAALRTTATLDPETGGFILHTPTPGAQKFMPNTSLAGGPKSAVVAARLMIDGEDQGVFLFLTRLSDRNGHLPGVHVRKLPDRTGTPVDHCLTAFEHVRLPREALLEGAHGRLDGEGRLDSEIGSARKRFLQSVGRVTAGKLCMSAGTLGMSRAALAIAVRHAHSRYISGPKLGERVPLAAHRSHHGRLLHSLATAYAMTFLHRATVSRWTEHAPEERADVERLVAIVKGWITWQARALTTEARERCGAQGFFPVNGISELTQNIEGGITAEGDNLVIWVKAGSEMLFGQEVERGADHPDLPSDMSLTSLPCLRDLLTEVVALWQARARTALRQGPKGDPLGRWNEASGPALEMVSAFAGLKAADAFIEAVAQAESDETRALLEQLCRLFLLRQIEGHTGDLLAEGHVSADHVRALPHLVNGVVAGLAPHMAALADAFDLPSEYLGALPIAADRRLGDAADEWARPDPLWH
ncbi:acyl-CoA dehydrogenase [Streptomyces narbonensis]|uniref:Acyl-CoA dehydrogenase n=1 Tax=Streptomyces narbonensis TaxID=67333 RepID=A0ABV3CIB3_9ACTN